MVPLEIKKSFYKDYFHMYHFLLSVCLTSIEILVLNDKLETICVTYFFASCDYLSLFKPVF